MTPMKLTAMEQKRYDKLFAVLQDMTLDFLNPEMARKYLPAEWREISTTPIPEKTRLTLRIDTDVAKFFRKLGPGYQATVNNVLRSFMLAKLTDILGEEPGGVVTEVMTDEIMQIAMSHEIDLQDRINEVRRMRLGFDANGE
ncbi:BrnA antitoxin of type II toxin-antitoxin system [Cognatiyoonia koreensis]|uniref:BrnA antitoxin of type II toxin-antitoxin system n=1 Tax=Cognatiyoonia koreensis TaxID=364200 RepID=A0A1I0N590_9RHOB|nr:BrnA antitoxin family protein [Cognatiyoonia koreensis]SEV96182.1 BrnA antitoxin of type II toxin-antitoxin system [Cognatiyoonia koreensis]